MTEQSNNFLDEDSFFTEILSSQSDLEERISSLKDFIDNKDYSLQDKLGELQKFFSSDSVRNATVDVLDKKIFGTALISAQKIYFEIVNNINESLQRNQLEFVENVKNHLNFLINLLKCWDVCINLIKALEKVSIADVKSFPVNLLELMMNAIKHCKTSEKDYGNCFQNVSEDLTLLFRQCINILNSFYALLDSVIQFDVNEGQEMNILLKIIDETGKLATLSSGMDAKTLTDMWKRFGKFSVNHHLEIKNISPNTITYHFKGLSESIVNVLLSISRKNQRTLNERSVLCCRVLLKILEKLCETYCGWIRNDTMIGIVILLINLFGYTEQCLKISDYTAELIKFIVSNFTFMIEMFLDVVFKNDSFKVALFNYGKNINSEDAIGYHLLLLTIMKKISTLSYELQRQWYSQECNIFAACFQNIDRLTKDICLGKLQIQMSRDNAQGSYLANIYEASCLNMFAIVCQITNSDFTELIMTLVKYLLGGKFFSSLLSSDVWCFICRLGSSDMCYSHFEYLIQIYEKLEKRKNDLNVIMLSNLLNRQYNFLSDKDKNNFINNITKNTDSHRWSSIVKVMDGQQKKQVQQRLDAFALNNKITKDLKSLEEQPTLNNFNLLAQDLLIIEVTEVPQDEQSIDTFIKMWKKIVDISSDCEGTVLLLLEDLAVSILRATHLQPGQNKYITSILESLVSLYPYVSSSVHLECCRFFDRYAANLTDCDSGVVAELFCRLLSDGDTCVKQQAFESFELLTRVCPNADLLSSVALAIRNSQYEVSKTLPAYLSGELDHRLVGFANIDEFFITLCDMMEKNKHVCLKRNQIDREEKILKLDENSTDFKIFDDMEKRADRICDDMEIISRFKDQLKKDTCDRLRRACKKFLEQCNT